MKKRTTTALGHEFIVGDDAKLVDVVVAHYHRTLLDSPEARAYLDGRSVTTAIIAEFGLGFANRSLGLALPKANRKQGWEVRDRLQRLGLFRDTGHEHFNGCVTFPVLDGDANVVQIYGRKITTGLRAGTPLHLYQHEDKRGVFNLAGVVGARTVILCEGVLDALTFVAHGHRNATCTFGTKLTSDVRRLLVEQKVERVLIAFDRDTEGDEGAVEVAKKLAELPLEILRVSLPRGMDPNDVARSKNPAEVLDRMIRHAEWLAGTGKPNVPKPAKTKPAKAIAPKPVERPTLSPPPTPEPVANTQRVGDELTVSFEDRDWRARGLLANSAHGTLRLNVLVRRVGVGFHVDQFDLYSARHRAAFVKLASEELCLDEKVLKTDLGHILLSAELAQAELLQQQLTGPLATADEMTVEDRDAALELLRDPRLVERIADDFGMLGVVGETDNLLLAYLVAISRRLASPLALVVQSSPAAGKSRLLEAVLELVPETERVSYSAMTGQALYYMGATGLRGKVLAISEEAGTRRASYALKLLQSEGSLKIASTGKDAITGRLVCQEYKVEGPVAIMTTTTAIDVDEELLSRCVVVAVDESPEQTAKIHDRQRWAQSLDGLLAGDDRHRIIKLHRDAQRLLRPVKVVNPFAPEMACLDLRVRSRRDHGKLLGLVEVIALLHQHQRAVQVVERDDHAIEYVEVLRSDIDVACRLLGTSVPGTDDLPPRTRRVLDLLAAEFGERSFTRREARERLLVGHTQLAVHLNRLVQMEFVLLHPAGSGRLARYELYVRPSLGPATGSGSTTRDLPGFSADLPGTFRPDSGGVPGDRRTPDSVPEDTLSPNGREDRNARAGNARSRAPEDQIVRTATTRTKT